jgi:hypothetical protein
VAWSWDGWHGTTSRWRGSYLSTGRIESPATFILDKTRPLDRSDSGEVAMVSPAARTVVPFAPVTKEAPANGADNLDTAGRTIVGLLQQAAGMAEENSRHALDVARNDFRNSFRTLKGGLGT